MTRTVVLDLGGVLLSSTAVLDALAARLGVGTAELERAYFPPREGYDLGDPDEAYWAAVGEALGIVVNAEVGLVKPGAAIYAEADRVFGTHDCVFLDDKPANVEAARAHGWEAHVWAGPEAALVELGEGGSAV